MTPRYRLVQLALACALATPPAAASTYDIFGFSARDVGMGGAMTSAARGYSATYYNPAGLTAHKQQHLGLGLTLTLPDLFVDRGAPASDRPTVTPSTHVGLSLGWLKPIPGVFEERVAVGMSIYLPANRLVRVEGVDPQSPQFYLYQNLQDKLLINAGVAVQALDWLSIGVGAQVLADLRGSVQLDLDVMGQTFDRRDMSVSLTPTVSLSAGILVEPVDGLAFGLSYRGSSQLAFELPVVVREGRALDLTIDVSQTVLWSPHQVSLGVSYQLEQPRLLLALDTTLALWSGAPDPSPQLAVDVGGQLLEAFGLASALDLSTRSRPIDLGFTDTMTARVGAEWEPLYWLQLRAGYFYRPTPAPRQTGSVSYLDNDAHVLSVGAGFAFKDPLQTRQAYVQLDLAAQLTFLPRRTAQRADTGDPIGDLSHGGALWTVTTTVSHSY